MTVCIHELETDQCGYCRPAPLPDPEDFSPATRVRTTTARYESRCASECNNAIEPGDRIFWSASGWICKECWEDV